MRITQLMIGTGFGGAERSFVDLALALADRGVAVQAICHRDFVKRGLLERHPRMQVSPVVVRGAWDLFAVSEIRRRLREFGPSVVHAHLSRGASLAGRAAAPLGLPVIAKLHNYTKLKYYARVDGFIGTTADQREYLLRHGIADERIAVVPNFIRLAAVESPRPVPAQGPIRFITCGRLHPVKGLDVLLRSLRRVRDAGGQAQLVIGGDGPERGLLLALARELGLNDCVQFAGWIDDVATFLEQGDVYVSSSRSESFGISLLEAAARGLGIISTRTAGPLQVLAESGALFCEPDDPASLAAAMLSCCRNPGVLAARARVALDRFRSLYSEESCVPQVQKFYDQQIAKKSCRLGLRRQHESTAEPQSVWPRDFIAVTQQQSRDELLVRPDAVALFGHRGWFSTAAILNDQSLQVLRLVNGRDNCRTELRSGTSAEVVRAFVKRHGVAAGDTATTDTAPARSGRLDAGWAEAEAAGLFQRAGVPCVDLLAAGRVFDHAGRCCGSVLVTQAMATSSLYAEFQQENLAGGPTPPQTTRRRELLGQLAASVRRMHDAGLYHGDLFLQHAFVRSNDTHEQVALIDLQLSRRSRSPFAWYRWIKDLSQVRFSLDRLDMDAETVCCWYENYFRTESLSVGAQLVAGLVRISHPRRLWKLWRRRRSGHQQQLERELLPFYLGVAGPPQERRAA